MTQTGKPLAQLAGVSCGAVEGAVIKTLRRLSSALGVTQ